MSAQNSKNTDVNLVQICQQVLSIGYEEIPSAVITKAQAQILSCLGAIYRGLPGCRSTDWNPRIDRQRPFPYDADKNPEFNILELAQLVSLLDYDEVILGGHVSQSAVLIPLVYGYQQRAAGTQILRAIVLTNEVAGRISITCALGNYRGQTALYVQQCAAVVARALMLELDAGQMAAALSLALSFITRMDSHQFFNSDLKLLSATVPLQQALYCVDQARNGLHCSLEFSNRHPLWARHYALLASAGVFDDLGEFWYTDGLSIKRYPACAYMCAALEATQQLQEQHQLRIEDIAHIRVYANLLQYLCDSKTRPLLANSAPHHTAIAFSTPLCLAAAFMPGLCQSPSTLQEHWPAIQNFCRSVSVHWDQRLAVDSLLSGMPMGFALARQPAFLAHIFIQLSLYQALGWRRYCLHLPRALRLAWGYQRGKHANRNRCSRDKTLGATVVIKTVSGRELRHHCPTQRGFSQADLSAVQLLQIGLEKFNHSKPQDVAAEIFACQSQMVLALTRSQKNVVEDHPVASLLKSHQSATLV